MTTRQRIERKGYIVTYHLTGWIEAYKEGTSLKALTITELLKLTRK